MLAMMLLLIADIAFRTVNLPLPAIAEMSVFVMMIVIYLGFARCEEHEEHVKLPFRGRSMLLALSQLLAVGTIGLLFYAVTTDAWDAFVTNSSIEGIVDLPIWPTKFIMVVGMVFFLLQGILNLGKAIRRMKQADEVEDEV